MKKIIFGLLIVLLTSITVVAAKGDDGLGETASFIIENVKNPTNASIGGEWAIIGLARSDEAVPDEYFNIYIKNLTDYTVSKNGVLHNRKYTEYSRAVLAVTLLGKDARNFSGYDLTAPLSDYEKTISQGINGAVWALIALDSGSYGTKDLKTKYLEYILELEKENGGWSLSPESTEAESDTTAMVLTSLAPYKNDPVISPAIERGINVLSALQGEDGTYRSFGNVPTSESSAQVLVALSSLGISDRDERFIKNGKTVTDGIMSFRLEDGSFCHTDEKNLMATEQCFYALVAKYRFENNKTPLFIMDEKKGDAENKVQINVPPIKEDIIPYFSDISDLKTQNAVYELTKRGIINGISDNIFSPDGNVTRAEFSAMVVRALGLETTGKSKFSDVNENMWYSEYVATAEKYGLINGISHNEFNPNGNVTIEQSCVIMARAFMLCKEENIPDDDETNKVLYALEIWNISPWARKDTAFCINKKILEITNKKITPFDYSKRYETAQMLYNLLKGAELI